MCGRARLSSDVSEIKLVFSIPPHRHGIIGYGPKRISRPPRSTAAPAASQSQAGDNRDTSYRCLIYVIDLFGVPYRIRTGVAAVRGRCPGPLDEGDEASGVNIAGRPEDQAPARRELLAKIQVLQRL